MWPLVPSLAPGLVDGRATEHACRAEDGSIALLGQARKITAKGIAHAACVQGAALCFPFRSSHSSSTQRPS